MTFSFTQELFDGACYTAAVATAVGEWLRTQIYDGPTAYSLFIVVNDSQRLAPSANAQLCNASGDGGAWDVPLKIILYTLSFV